MILIGGQTSTALSSSPHFGLFLEGLKLWEGVTEEQPHISPSKWRLMAFNSVLGQI